MLAMLDEVRGTLLRLLNEVDPAALHWSPPGLQNTMLWHAGHAYMVLETITQRSLGREPAWPSGWWELFSWDSEPGKIAADAWPKLADVQAALVEQQARLRALLAELSEETLAGPAVAWPDRSVRRMVLHAMQDEAAHKGEIWLLQKLYAHR